MEGEAAGYNGRNGKPPVAVSVVAVRSRFSGSPTRAFVRARARAQRAFRTCRPSTA